MEAKIKMKKLLGIFLTILLVLALSLAVACSKDDPTNSSVSGGNSSISTGDSSVEDENSSTEEEADAVSIEYLSGLEVIEAGWEADLSNLKIKVNYSNGTSKEIAYTDASADFSCSYDDSKLGFTYAEITYGNLSCEAKVNVVCYPVVNAPRLLAHTKDTKFKLQSEQYVVGDDNKFYFLPTLSAEDEDENPIIFDKIGEVEIVAKIALKNGDNYVDLELSSAYAEVDTVNACFDFTDEAIGKTFKITVYPKVLDYVGTADDISTNTFIHEFKVIDGYNVYNATDLLLFDNRAENNSFRAEKGITADPNAIKGLVLHNNIILTANDFPASNFYYETNNASDFTGLSDEKKALLEGSLKDYVDLYKRDLGATGQFVFEGNYFVIDASKMPYVVRNNDDPSMTTLPGSIVSHATLFGVNGKAIRNGVSASENFEIRNVRFTGNLNRQENVEKSGGLILSKVRSAKGLFYNTVSTGWYVNTFAEQNIENHELTVDHCVFEDAYSSLMYIWGGYVNILNSRVYGAGGPALIADHCYFRSNDGRTGANGWTSDIYIDEASEVASYVTGQEAWFKEFNASAAAGKIFALDQMLFSQMGKTFLTTKTVDGGTQTLMNLPILMKSGYTEGMTSEIISGVTKIGSHVLDFDEATTKSMIATHGGKSRNMFQSKNPSTIVCLVDETQGLLQGADNSYYTSQEHFMANAMFLPNAYGGDAGFLNIFIGGTGDGFMGAILGDFRDIAA